MQPLPPEQWDDFQKANPLNVFTTLARHPTLYRAWLRFGGALLYGTLPARDRELAILRTAHHRGSAYEWAQHVRIAREAGLSDQEIESVRQADATWEPADRLVLRVADELHTGGDLSDATWAALCERYDEPGRIELVMLVAHYDMLAVVLNTLRVRIED
ncbi:carboxymuconolactone decarboxylase [Nonomuraea cavernae]|uniref:Carboxymuconolactone decarboxylase n=1 Tax=Nonomuraea cavernae TaxID=2045107 RepID=A0A917Z7P0_9ACTN|nr:carboxymuconolactone decarboxylase [Nonomuraea cavernae]